MSCLCGYTYCIDLSFWTSNSMLSCTLWTYFNVQCIRVLSCNKIYEVFSILHQYFYILIRGSTLLCRRRPFAVTGSVPHLFTAIRWSDATCHTCTRYLWLGACIITQYKTIKEEAASSALMLAVMLIVTARMEMYQFLKCSKLDRREQSISNYYGGSDGCPIMRVLHNRSPGVQHQSTLILG